METITSLQLATITPPANGQQRFSVPNAIRHIAEFVGCSVHPIWLLTCWWCSRTCSSISCFWSKRLRQANWIEWWKILPSSAFSEHTATASLDLLLDRLLDGHGQHWELRHTIFSSSNWHLRKQMIQEMKFEGNALSEPTLSTEVCNKETCWNQVSYISENTLRQIQQHLSTEVLVWQVLLHPKLFQGCSRHSEINPKSWKIKRWCGKSKAATKLKSNDSKITSPSFFVANPLLLQNLLSAWHWRPMPVGYDKKVFRKWWKENDSTGSFHVFGYRIIMPRAFFKSFTRPQASRK